MSIVDFDTAIWSDGWYRKLTPKDKLLFVFLWTNDHKRITGIYEIDFDTISFFTGLTHNSISQGLEALSPKVKYDYDREIVWVVNFVRHQFMRTPNISDQIKRGIENNLVQMKGHSFVGEFFEEYPTLTFDYPYKLETPYRGSIDLPGGGGGGGEGKDKKDAPEAGKASYGDYVKMTEEEHKKLVSQYGEFKTKKMIQVLDEWLGSSGKKRKSHYLCIGLSSESWVARKVLERYPDKPHNPIDNKPMCEKCKRLPSRGQFDDGKEYCERCWPNRKEALRAVGDIVKGTAKPLPTGTDREAKITELRKQVDEIT